MEWNTNDADYYPTDGGASVNTDGDDYPDEIHPGWTENASAYLFDLDNSVFEITLMADSDDDNDGYLDTHVDGMSDPLLSTNVPIDSDGDGVCDVNDDDIDGDGVSNVTMHSHYLPVLQWTTTVMVTQTVYC